MKDDLEKSPQCVKGVGPVPVGLLERQEEFAT